MSQDAMTQMHGAAERAWQLRVRSSRVIEEAGFKPGRIREIPTDTGYRLAFGYICREAGGTQHRYLEVPVTLEDYHRMDEAVQAHVLEALRHKFGEIAK